MKVSIITPYSSNYKHFLPECQETVRNQTFQDFEHILWEYNEKPFNLPRARNQAIRTASGEYIVALDIDDKLHPTYLERCLEFATPNTIVTTSLETFGDTKWVRDYSNEEFTFDHFIRRNRAHVTSMYSRKIYDKLGGYDERFPAYEDWDFWTRAASFGFKFHPIKDVLFFYRQHLSQMTKSVPSSALDLFISKHLPPFPVPWKASDPYL